MMNILRLTPVAVLLLGAAGATEAAETAPGTPASFAIGERPVILTAHGVGAQIYECKGDAGASPAWALREPVATLLRDGRTVGRHYAGPNWDLADGSGVKGKLLASEPGATPADIPQLKLEVVEHRGDGSLREAAMVLRLRTVGGRLDGPCERPGDLRSVPYAADYVFLK